MHLGGTIRVNKIGIAIVCGTLFIFLLYMIPRVDNSDNSSHKVNLRRLLLVSIEAAEKGGKEVLKVIKQANLRVESKGETKEGVKVSMTNADYKSHCIMYYSISKTFPSIKVISEEKDGEKDCQQLLPLELEALEKKLGMEDLLDVEVDANDVTVWIDPLDATKEYTEALYEYVTTMVCVAYKGRPVIGVIHKPFSTEPRTTWAWNNKGMSQSLKENRNHQNNKKKLVVISKSHAGPVEKLVKDVFGDDTTIIHAGGSGYKSLEVAVGNVTAYVHKTEIQKWDVCAGDAIISALRGSFTSLDGSDLDYSASSPIVNKDGIFATLEEDPNKYLNKFQLLKKTE